MVGFDEGSGVAITGAKVGLTVWTASVGEVVATSVFEKDPVDEGPATVTDNPGVGEAVSTDATGDCEGLVVSVATVSFAGSSSTGLLSGSDTG